MRSRDNTSKLRANQLCAKYRVMKISRLAGAVLALVLLSILSLVAPRQAWAQAEMVLYSFPNTTSGFYALGRLTADGAGNFYGTTPNNGTNGDGVVFELSPEPQGGCASGSNPGNGWCETVLYSFCSLSNCADGSTP